MDGMITTCKKHDELATSTRAEVEKALAGTDTSDLRGSFRRALSFSIPPRTLYHSYRPGEYSDLIFGVPLVDVETNEDNVPNVTIFPLLLRPIPLRLVTRILCRLSIVLLRYDPFRPAPRLLSRAQRMTVTTPCGATSRTR
ncbi:hypothetical protein EDB89DRAFT_390126 [Lactarius sanguifluus]|nr:hypothetical protein EDB89DRAFT_390126 [Lactarius sanguifluus]